MEGKVMATMTQLQQTIGDGLMKMRQEIIRKSQDAGQEASGKTYQEIIVDVEGNDLSVEGSITAPVYFHTLLRGRGPGKVPANLPEILMEWARVKGITFEDPEELVRFANNTAWKIRLEGSKLFRNHAYIDLTSEAQSDFEQMLEKELDAFMTAQIDENFLPDYLK